MNQTPDPQGIVKVDEATPADYPEVARLLANGFSTGKYVLALGRDVNRRIILTEILLRHRALVLGTLYVVRLDDTQAVATCVIKYDNTPVGADDQRAARQELAQHIGGLRAWWTTTVLRLLDSPKVGPTSCYVDNLVVDSALRRQQVAHRMTGMMYDIARSKGKTEMHAHVIASNKPIRAFLVKQGWEIISRNYTLAPVTLPLLGFAGIYAIRKNLI